MSVLFFGDLVGKPGRRAMKEFLPELSEKHHPDLIIANGENASGGFGLTVDVAREMFDAGVDIITSGNHIWDKKEIIDYLEQAPTILRPANYPNGTPGGGTALVTTHSGVRVLVLNLIGRRFMGLFDDPFALADRIVDEAKRETPVIIVDFHGEDTREKAALARYLDGRVSTVIGTHTHVQTADERILPLGTAFITDAGMTGPTDSVIGVKKERAVARFLTSIPQRFETAKAGIEAQGVLIHIEPQSGRARSIERFRVRHVQKGRS
ncbi:MAG: TIGR00282 family metallophosphoesterase [Deltaproteobacteria bacterium]|nr:TIGR00282 family metallophosphoesterase [Candidatus Zymogenaceae bacterium]